MKTEPRRPGGAAGRAAWAALALGAGLMACAPPPPPLAQLSLSLSPPPQVHNLRVEVFDLQDDRALVATASVAAAELGPIPLGVPAERRLELRVTAYTRDPLPAGLIGGGAGGADPQVDWGAADRRMPAYVARREVEIPLSDQRQQLSMRLHPAGLLYAQVDDDAAIVAHDLMLRVHRLDGLEPDLWRPLSTGKRPWAALALLLREGMYALSVTRPGKSPILNGAATVYVGREGVSRTQLWLTEAAVRRDPLRLSLTTQGGDPVALRPGVRLPAGGGERALVVQLAAEDATEELVGHLRWTITQPDGTVSSQELPGGVLPNRFPVTLKASGRLVIEVSFASNGQDRRRARLAVNVLPEGVTPGPPAALQLKLPWPEDRRLSTSLEAWLLDAGGYFAAPGSGRLQVRGSSPWLDFGSEAAQGWIPPGYGPLQLDLSQCAQPWSGGVALKAQYPGLPEAVMALPSLF